MKKTPSKTLTDRQAAEIESLAALSDDEIDKSDISEILNWSDARRGLLYRPAKNRVPGHPASQARKGG